MDCPGRVAVSVVRGNKRPVGGIVPGKTRRTDDLGRDDNVRERIRRWLFWKTEAWDDLVCDRDWPLWAFMPDWVGRLACAVLFSHEAIQDNCGKPDHDFCVWCRKSMPNQAPRP